MDCINCGSTLSPVFEPQNIPTTQFNDALHIQLHFGYGEYHDQGPDQEGSPYAFFCLGCASELEMKFPGIRKMIRGE